MISVWLQVGCEQCVIENAEACEATVNTVQPMDLHMYPKVESECGQNQTFGTHFTVQHITLDQMSSFVMTSRNITNGADKQRMYKVLWCAKCSSPMFSKTMCPTKRI